MQRSIKWKENCDCQRLAF